MPRIESLTHHVTGQPVKAEVVDIDRVTESPTRLELADGTTLRVKVDVLEAARILDDWDKDGKPMYQIRRATLVAVLNAPDNLWRKNRGR